jgi:hypothetical protein
MTDTPRTPPGGFKSVAEQITESLTGYKRPPEATRFKTGQSGNPNGRPPKAKATNPDVAPQRVTSAYDRILADEMARPQTVTEKGKRKRMTTHALIVRQATNTALKGSPTAQGTVLREVRALEDRNVQRAHQEAESDAKWNDILDAMKARQTAAWNRWLQTGEAPTDVFPHPDDIDDMRRKPKRILRWPFYEEDLPRAVYFRLQRDKAMLFSWQDDRTSEAR